MNRRYFIAGAITALLPLSALAAEGEDADISEALGNWFAGLERPDYDDATMGSIKSCCDAGDAYPIKILEEATIGGKVADGFATVTDPSARHLHIHDRSVDGSEFIRQVFRQKITGPLDIRFAGELVTREKNGNPTKTAWAFLRVEEGLITKVYCVVPLPPSF